MKISLVCLSNGIDLQKYTANAARELAKRHEVSLITTKWFERALVPSGVTHYPAGLTRTPRLDPQLLNPVGLIRLLRAVAASSPDIVHFTTAHPLHLYLAKLYPRARKVFTIHDPIPHPDEPISRFVAFYNKLVFGGLADRVIIHGRSHFEALSQLGIDTHRFRYAPLGEIYGPDIPPPYPSEPSMLFFGRIRPYKGLDVFLRAATLVVKQLPGTKVIVAGQGDLTPYRDLLDIPNLELTNEFIPDSKEKDFFTRARVVVLPYTSATQSGVIPVAYSYARPVVATQTGSIPEMVVDGVTGFLTPPRDPEALAFKCLEILADSNRGREMGTRAREFFLHFLTPVAMAREFDTIYEELRNDQRGKKRE